MVKNIDEAINNIQWRQETSESPRLFEVKIWEEDKLVYHNKGYAGVVNIVQSDITMEIEPDKKVSMSGDSQAFGWGAPLEQIFAFDQLQTKLNRVWKLAEEQFNLIKSKYIK